MRSLVADSYRTSLLGVGLASGLLLLWAVWFFLAPLTIIENGQLLRVTGDGIVTAQFPAKATEHLQPGQAAVIWPQGANGEEIGPISATVADVATQGENTLVELYAHLDARNAAAFQTNLTGQVNVEVERISPAILVLRASGQLVDTPPVSLSPQTR